MNGISQWKELATLPRAPQWKQVRIFNCLQL